MDAEGEVQRGGAGGKFFELAGGGIDEYLILEDVGLERLYEIFRFGDVALPFENLAQPNHVALERVAYVSAVLV